MVLPFFQLFATSNYTVLEEKLIALKYKPHLKREIEISICAVYKPIFMFAGYSTS